MTYNVDTIHSTILNNLRSIIDLQELDNLDDFEQASDIECLYTAHMLKHYAKYSRSPSQENINRYMEEISRFSILEKYNTFVVKYSLPPIHFSTNLYKISNNNWCDCDCGGTMRIQELSSSFVCSSCNQIKQFIGIISDTVTSANGKTLVLKNNYNHRGYFHTIYKNIFAVEGYYFPKSITKLVLNAAKEHCKTYNEDMVSLRCSWFKRILTINKQTTYFPHVNLLKKNTTGVGPPQLTETEQSKLNMYYTVYMELFNKLVKSKDPRKSYYRCEFVIYKILEQILPDSERKTQILVHIDLPQKDTLEKLDLNYEKICLGSDNILIYKSTIRSGY